MAVVNFSPLLGFALPTTGDLAGTWGTTVNDAITSLVDSSIAGTTTLSADVDVTLSTTNGGSNQARQAVLLCTGARSVLRTITAPAQSKAYIVINATTGGFGVKLVGAGPTAGVTIANGDKALVVWNGSDFVVVAHAAITVSDITGLGTGVATALGQNVTGSGGIALATSPSFTTPTLGAATATSINKVILTAPSTSATVTISDGKTLAVNNSLTLAGTDATTMTFPSISASVGFLNIPAVGAKTSAYILTTADVGKYVEVGTGGSIEIPNSTFAAGDAVSIFNNTSSSITITCTITTAYVAGTDTDVASVNLATRGVATVLFISGTVCVITGNVS